MAPPRYDEDFKEGAIRMVCEQGRLSSDVAQKLGICVDTLRSWLSIAAVFQGNSGALMLRKESRYSSRTGQSA